MRLTCPSCEAEYEIEPGALGARGRTVRCSNCSAEWFLPRQPTSVAEAAAAVEMAARTRPRPSARQEVIEPDEDELRADPDRRADDAELAEESAPDEPAGGEAALGPDELAASLRAEEPQGPGAGASFLAGFVTVAVLAFLLISVYAKQDVVAALAPAAKPALASYVDLVDQGREALARLVSTYMPRA